MHSTEHKRGACALHPWDRRDADRVCEHGDTPYKQERKRSAKKARRAVDKKESQ